MNRNDRIFRLFYSSILIIVFIVFIFSCFLETNNSNMLEKILNAMSIAGFVGMFGSFILTLVQEYVARKNYNICVLCKKSQFSLSIIQGIQSIMIQKPNVKVDIYTYSKEDDPNSQIESFLSNEAYQYDGIMIRPIDITEKMYTSIIELIERNRKIVLIDINLNIEQQKCMKSLIKPVHVCSDFSLGGKLLADFIKKFIETNGIENTRLILFIGPNTKASARKRCKSLLLSLAEVNYHRIAEIVSINSFNVQENLELFNRKIKIWKNDSSMDLKNKNVIVFCGNDAIAKEIMIQMNDKHYINPIKEYFKEVANIVFLGYDGIRGSDGEYELDSFGYNYVTIDVLPQNQGRQGAEILYCMLENKKEPIYKKDIVYPEIVERVKQVNREKEIIYASNIKDIDYLLSGREAFIFDLDGTIADTEVFHWKAYNVLLSSYGVKLKNEDIKKYIGNTESLIYEMIKKDFKIEFSNEEFLMKRLDLYFKFLEEEGLKPFLYFTEMLHIYPNAKYLMLTSQKEEVAEKLLKYWNLTSRFEKVLSVSNTAFNKKDVIRNVNKYFNVNKKNIVFFEDVDQYLEVAENEGITAIGVQQTYNEGLLVNCSAIIKGYFEDSMIIEK